MSDIRSMLSSSQSRKDLHECLESGFGAVKTLWKSCVVVTTLILVSIKKKAGDHKRGTNGHVRTHERLDLRAQKKRCTCQSFFAQAIKRIFRELFSHKNQLLTVIYSDLLFITCMITCDFIYKPYEAAASQPWSKTSRSLKKRAQALRNRKMRSGTGRSHDVMKNGMDRSHTHIGRCLKKVTNTNLGRSHGKVSTGHNQKMCGGINGRNHMMRSTQQITNGRSRNTCGGINGRNHMMNLSHHKTATKPPHVGHGQKNRQPAPPLRQPLQTHWKRSSRTNTGPMSCS